MSETIAVVSAKGGVGKTTVSLNLSLALAERGLRTLLVDLDPQGAVGHSLQKDDTDWPGIVEVIAGSAAVESVVVRTREPKLALLPRGRLDPVDAVELEARVGAKGALAALLAPLMGEFDRVVLDTPAGVGAATRGALGAAQWALVVFKAEPLALRTLQQTLRVVQHAREDNPRLRLLGILPTLVELAKDHAQTPLVELWSGFGAVLDTTIPRSDAIARASMLGVPVGYQAGPPLPEARRFEQLAAELEGILHPESQHDEARPARSLL